MKNLFLLALSIFILTGCSEKIIRIACIGDSITEGAGITLQNRFSYPARLDSLLGTHFSVLNSGKGGTTLQKEGDFPYWNTKEFSNNFIFEPNIVVIKLGTNDTKPQNWNRERFETDYQLLIDTLKTMRNLQNIFLCIPVPVFGTHWGINDSTLQNGVIPSIKKIAFVNKLPLFDLNKPLQNDQFLFPDQIHPNEEGAKKIAEIIASYIKKN
jgi:alpha-L-fucosidase 2